MLLRVTAIAATALIAAATGAQASHGKATQCTSMLTIERYGNLQKLALDSDVLVAHLAIDDSFHFGERSLHAPPGLIGEIAAADKTTQVILSHRRPETLGKEQELQSMIAKSYKGPIAYADDLDCFSLRGAKTIATALHLEPREAVRPYLLRTNQLIRLQWNKSLHAPKRVFEVLLTTEELPGR